jgi:amino acid transporter
MGLLAGTSIGVGGMIGAGIFSLLGIAAERAGDDTYLAFILAGAVALFCAYSFGRLGARYPSAGGPVEFLNQGFSNSYLVGTLNLLLWFGYVVVNALYARAFSEYTVALLGLEHDNTLLSNGLIVFVVLVFTLINRMGGSSVGRSELVLVVLKLTILLSFAGATAYVNASIPDLPRSGQWTHVIFTASLVFMAYEGFGLVTNAAEDMKNVKTNLPKALAMSVVVVIFTYTLVSLGVTNMLSADAISSAKEYALAEAAKPLFGQWGFSVISIAAMLSTASAINATLYGGANVSYIMAENGRLPPQFKRRLWQVAQGGLIYTAVLVVVIAIALPVEKIAMAGSLSFLAIYGAVNVAHLKLLKHTGAKRPIVLFGLLGCILGFLSLVAYAFETAIDVLYIFSGFVGLSFFLEVIFQQRTCRQRKMEKRAPPVTG